MTAKTRKSLHDLRSMSGRITNAEKPQRRYVRLALLELEKIRRDKEMARTIRQMKDLDRRLKDIIHEQEQLLKNASSVAAGLHEAPRPGPPSSAVTISY
jgi:dsDNA-specific endonuclease/ATPase MutS2